MDKNEGNRGSKAMFGSRKHRKSRFDFGEQGSKAMYFSGTRKQPWEDLTKGKCQEDNSFPADNLQTILNKTNKTSKTNRKVGKHCQ